MAVFCVFISNGNVAPYACYPGFIPGCFFLDSPRKSHSHLRTMLT